MPLGYLSTGTTVLSNLSLAGDFVTANITSANITSTGTVNLVGGKLSVASAADATGLGSGELKLVFLASGVSLVWSSGASYYIINSASSAAQA